MYSSIHRAYALVVDRAKCLVRRAATTWSSSFLSGTSCAKIALSIIRQEILVRHGRPTILIIDASFSASYAIAFVGPDNNQFGGGGIRGVNRIEAIRTPSRYLPEPHLAIAVDGVPLDELLDAARPDLQLAGLVSSLLGWFHDEADCLVPWQRVLPAVGCSGYAPLLICPDDLDFSCSVVMAEVVGEAEVIRWDRLGFDATHRGAVGSYIRWEPGLGPFRFSRREYEACLAAFKPPDAEPGAAPDPSRR